MPTRPRCAECGKLAQLIESGRVDLNAPVQRYVPNWTGAGKESVTVRHLLTHTSGLPAFRPYDQQTHDSDSLAALIFATPLERAPGDSMVYSDIGAFMMGRIVESVSGRRLDRYLAARVFTPLRMTETMFNPPRALWKRVAPTEFDSTRGGLVHGKVHDERAYYLGGIAAHAGLFSTAADLTRFATDTAVTPAGAGRFEARIDGAWWVYRGPNGGYVGAIVMRAMTEAVGDQARAARAALVHPTVRGARASSATASCRAGRSSRRRRRSCAAAPT